MSSVVVKIDCAEHKIDKEILSSIELAVTQALLKIDKKMTVFRVENEGEQWSPEADLKVLLSSSIVSP